MSAHRVTVDTSESNTLWQSLVIGEFNQTACCFDVSFISESFPILSNPLENMNWRSFLRPTTDIILIKGWWSLNVCNRETQLAWVCFPKTSVCLWSLWFGSIHWAPQDGVLSPGLWFRPSLGTACNKSEQINTSPNPSLSSHNHSSLVNNHSPSNHTETSQKHSHSDTQWNTSTIQMHFKQLWGQFACTI